MQIKPSLERKNEKDAQNHRNCATQNLTTLLTWCVNTCDGTCSSFLRRSNTEFAQGHADIHCVVPTQSSPDSHAVDQQQNCRGRECFRRIRQEAHRDREHKNQQPRVTYVAPKPEVKTTFSQKIKRRKKRGQRGILESRDIRQAHSTRRVEVNCQNRDLQMEDDCSCLAEGGNRQGELEGGALKSHPSRVRKGEP